MGENRNKRNRRRSRNGLGNRMALIGITMVVLSLAVVVNVGASSLREKDLEYQAREAELERQKQRKRPGRPSWRNTGFTSRPNNTWKKLQKKSWAWSKKTKFCLRERNLHKKCHVIFWGEDRNLTNISF